jgi:hypothetical protein
MIKQKLFDLIGKTIKHSQIDFEEVYVGDEEDGQVYFLFKNVKEIDGENQNESN